MELENYYSGCTPKNIHIINFSKNFSEISQLYNSSRKCTEGMINSPPNSTDSKTSLINFLSFRNYSTLKLYRKMHKGYD